MSAVDVLYTVERLLKVDFSKANHQFKKGFGTCLKLFEIGLSKRIDYNLAIRNRDLEEENKQLKKMLNKKYQKLRDLEHDMSSITIMTGTPLEFYREVLIETEIGNFIIVVNMDENTLHACILNFAIKKKFTTINEGKSKLMDFINTKKELGFRAFRDAEVAVKEGARML